MTNLEKIREAWRIGWAAVIKLEENSNRAVIVNVNNEVSTVVFIDGSVRGMPCILNSENLTEYSIVDYRYVGELAGNEEPREGQKFKIKLSGKIEVYQSLADVGFYLLPGRLQYFQEIEPYFE